MQHQLHAQIDAAPPASSDDHTKLARTPCKAQSEAGPSKGTPCTASSGALAWASIRARAWCGEACNVKPADRLWGLKSQLDERLGR